MPAELEHRKSFKLEDMKFGWIRHLRVDKSSTCLIINMQTCQSYKTPKPTVYPVGKRHGHADWTNPSFFLGRRSETLAWVIL